MSEHQQPPAYDPTLRLIERSGVGILLVYVATLIAVAIIEPDPYAGAWHLIIGNLFLGRAYNITVGLKEGYSNVYLFFQCGLGDIILLLLVYPLLVAGYRRAIEWRFVGPSIANIRASAEKHKHRIERFGALGLTLFVFFPAWSTGALVAGVVGYLVGMRTSVMFTSIIIGNFLSVAAWIWLIDWMRSFSESLGHWLPWIVAGSVVGLAVAYRVHLIRRKMRERKPVKEE
ncbi:MAG: small multi-drug export protein [Candidatus Hydrogenedentes bacterium]|nr:small multi-drug export protein [Candidatus Hydrogenedentota bacterium]